MKVVYAFDDLELDATRFELRRLGRPVVVQAKVMDLLLYLVTNRARLLTKQELLEQVWPGLGVGPASVSHAIMEARKVIGDLARAPRMILTVRGRGYRFASNVKELRADGSPLPAIAAFPRGHRCRHIVRARPPCHLARSASSAASR